MALGGERATGRVWTAVLVASLCLLRPAWAERPPGIACDGREWTDLSFTAGGHAIRSATYSFTRADVGKLFAGAYESGGGPGAVRTVTSVDGGAATLSGRGFAGSRSGNGDAFFGSDDTEALQRAVDLVDPNGRAVVVTLPPGRCLISRTIKVIDTNGFRLEGAGIGLTTLLATSAASVLAVIEAADRREPDQDGAALVLSGFSIVKLPGANGGARFSGTAVYVGNANAPPGLPTTGHTVLTSIAVHQSDAGDGWRTGFEGENLANASWSDLQVANAAGEPAAGDIPMPAATAQDAPPTWARSTAPGNGTSFYWHGSHGAYAIDSTFVGLTSVGGQSAFDFRDAQGVHIIAAHFIGSSFGIRELASEPGVGDELFSLHDSLVQSRYRDLTIVGSTDNEIGGNLFWGYGDGRTADPLGWIGFWLTGFSQSTTFEGNVVVDADPVGWGVYDCMRPFAHTIAGNSFQYLRHGITTCRGEANAAITSNAFAGMGVPNDIENHGSNVVMNNNRSGAEARTE